jgi:hypothetical protein
MSELERDVDALLRAAELETEATPDDRARMRRKLAKRLGAAVITASTAGSVSAHAAPMTTFKIGAWLAKGAKVVTVLHGVPLALAIGATAALPIAHAVRESSHASITTTIPAKTPTLAQPRSSPIEPRLATDTPPPARSEPSVEPPPVESPSVEAPPAARPSRATAEKIARPAPAIAAAIQVAPSSNEPPREVRPPEPVDGAALLEEYTLIARMHRALGARDQAALSRAIDDHRQRFGSGVLVEEREAMNAMFECMRSATPVEAAAIASNFVARYPRSLHAARVEASCGDRAR